MEQINQIREKLRPHLGWHGARLAFVAMFLVTLFRAKTVNLAELASVWMGKAEEESNYKRMQRFFRSFDFDILRRFFSNLDASFDLSFNPLCFLSCT